MKLYIFLFSAALFLFSFSDVDAQDKKIYINASGQVIQTSESIPSTAFYINKNGVLKSVSQRGTFELDGNSIVLMKKSESRGGNASSIYYIGTDMQLHKLEGEWPSRSYYTNEYGKLLENKGKKKTNTSTN